MNREEIKTILPHRDPFLFLDEVTEVFPGVSAAAVWNITGEEHFFKGHFPSVPVLPGVLIIEALAQTGAVSLLSTPENKGKTGYMTGVDRAKFRRKVVPGDRLELEAKIIKTKMGIGFAECRACVEGSLAASAVISFAVV